MGKPNLLKTLGTGLTNLGGNIVDTVTFMDKKAVGAFNSVKDKLLSIVKDKEETEDTKLNPLEEQATDLVMTLERNHTFNEEAANLSEVPSEKKPMVRRRALATIEAIGVLKKILGPDTTKSLVSQGEYTYDDIEAAALGALIKTKP